MDFDDKLHKTRKIGLALAEMVDAWRVVPRTVLLAYSYLVGYMVWTFLTYEPIVKTVCDSKVMEVLLDKGIGIEQVREIACTATSVIGPPLELTGLVSVVIGASAAVFGLYKSGSKDWSKPPSYWNGGKQKPNEKDDTDV